MVDVLAVKCGCGRWCANAVGVRSVLTCVLLLLLLKYYTEEKNVYF